MLSEHMYRKLTREEVRTLPIEQLYEIVQQGKVYENFPHGVWQRPDSDENAVKLVKYCMLKHKVTKEDLYVNGINWSSKLFNLSIPIYVRRNFKYGMFTIYQEAVPELELCEMPKKPRGFWDSDEDVVHSLKYFMQRDKITDVNDITIKLIDGVWGMRDAKVKHNGIVGLILLAFPEIPIESLRSEYLDRSYWTPEFSIRKLEFALDCTGRSLDNIDMVWIRDNGLRPLVEMQGGLNQAINYAYQQDTLHALKYRYTKSNVLNSLRGHLEEEPTRELAVNLSTSFYSSNLCTVFRAFRGRKHDLLDWLFNSDIEYYGDYLFPKLNFTEQYDLILEGELSRFSSGTFNATNRHKILLNLFKRFDSSDKMFDNYTRFKEILISNKLITLAISLSKSEYEKAIKEYRNEKVNGSV